jgi:hypothetical protein
MRALVQSTLGRDFAPDGRLSLTLRRLVKPGRLSQDWVEGRQQRHLGPMRLFLLCLFLQVTALQLQSVVASGIVQGSAASTSGAVRVVIEVGPVIGQDYALMRHDFEQVSIVLNAGLMRRFLHEAGGQAKVAMEQMSQAMFLRTLSLRSSALQAYFLAAMVPLVVALHFAAFALLLNAVLTTIGAGLAAALWRAADSYPQAGLWLPGLDKLLRLALAAACVAWWLMACRRLYPDSLANTAARGVGVLLPLILAWPYLEVLGLLASLT